MLITNCLNSFQAAILPHQNHFMTRITLLLLSLSWCFMNEVLAQSPDKSEIKSTLNEHLNNREYRAMIASANTFLAQTEAEDVKGYLYMSIGNGYAYLGENPEAERAYEKAYNLYLQQGDTLEACAVQGNIAGLKTTSLAISEALSMYEAIFACAERYNDLELQAQVYNNRGGIFMFLGSYDEALQDLFAALEISERQGDTTRIGMSLSNIGGLYHIRGLITEAVDFYQQALALFEQVNDVRMIGRTLYNIGSIYLEQKNYRDAERLLTQSEEILRKCEDRDGLMLVITELGRLKVLTREPEAARLKLDEALGLAELNEDVVGQISVLNLLSEAALNDNNVIISERYARQALELATTGKFLAQRMESYNRLFAVLKRRRQYQEALYMNERYFDLRDSIRNEEHAEELLSFKARYEYDKKLEADRLEAEALQAELRFAVELAEQRRRTTMATGTSISIVLFLIGLGVYRRRMHQNKLAAKERESQFKEELIEASETVQENERKRIARDLHDEFAGTLSAARLSIASIPTVNDDQSNALLFLKEQLSESIHAVRRISKDLLPPTLEQFGLAAALQDFADTTARASGIAVNTFIDPAAPRLEAKRELALYRIVQEMTNNALKHAEASALTIRFGVDSNDLVLAFSDNGKGFDYEQIRNSRSRGLGLKNLINRANRAGGTMDFKSAIGAGTQIQITIQKSTLS
jgi:signal transduction histidine kinase